METEIYNLYKTQKIKKTIIKNFIKEFETEFLNANSQDNSLPTPKPVKGCKYLHTLRYSEMKDWNVRGLITRKIDLTEEQKLLCDKIEYMEKCGHGGIVNIINMLIRIINKGMKGCYKGRGQLNYDCICDDEGENAKHDEFLKENFVGHFHHDWKAVRLTEADVKCIKNVLERNNLLS